MPRLFVFGIGGTGSRVLKSLIMLLSSGVRASNYDIVPIIIDPHKDLKELNRCKSLLKLYSEINSELVQENSDAHDVFFSTKIRTLSSLAPETGIQDDYDFDERHDISFREFIELQNLSPNSPTAHLLSLLYSDENFSNSLSVGFKGNPNVGSLVLNYLTNSPGIRAFETAFGNDDRIFIVSSIFGGTGAAGFPLLLKNFRQHPNARIAGSKIGALTIMPYFKLSDPDGGSEKSDIDSGNFLTKTKAALTYYTRPTFTGLYNNLYYLGDPDSQNKPYENNEREQANKAHLVELLGAYSIIHFAHDTALTNGQVYEYCLKDNKDVIDFSNLADETSGGKKGTPGIAGDLTALTIFDKLHKSVRERTDLPFSKACTFDQKFFNAPFFKKLEEFMNDYYLPWLNELRENERSFNPFNMTIKDGFNSLVHGHHREKSRWDGLVTRPFDESDLWLRMAMKVNTHKHLAENNKVLQYFMMSRLAIRESISDVIAF